MRRMLIAGLILAVIVVLSFWEVKITDEICNAMHINTEKLENAEGGALSEAVKKVEDEWRKKGRILEMLASHDMVEEINVSMAEYKRYAETGRYTEAGHILGRIRVRLEEMRKRTKISVENIF